MNKEQIQTFDRKEAARLLSVSVVTVDRLVVQKQISHCRVGRRVLFTQAHLSEYLKRNERKAK